MTITNENTGETYATIQGAIDAATPGDEIGVTDTECPYNPDFTIDIAITVKCIDTNGDLSDGILNGEIYINTPDCALINFVYPRGAEQLHRGF